MIAALNPPKKGNSHGRLSKDAPSPTEIKLHQTSRVLEIAFSDGKCFKLPYEFLRVGGELPVKRQSGFEIDRGNAVAMRDDQAKQEQVRMHHRVAQALCRRVSGARDACCNSP